jgi:hypothetical protein
VVRSLEQWESEEEGWEQGHFGPMMVNPFGTCGSPSRLYARTHFAGPPMHVVKGACREGRRENIAIAQSRMVDSVREPLHCAK